MGPGLKYYCKDDDTVSLGPFCACGSDEMSWKQRVLSGCHKVCPMCPPPSLCVRRPVLLWPLCMRIMLLACTHESPYASIGGGSVSTGCLLTHPSCFYSWQLIALTVSWFRLSLRMLIDYHVLHWHRTPWDELPVSPQQSLGLWGNIVSSPYYYNHIWEQQNLVFISALLLINRYPLPTLHYSRRSTS